LPWWEIGVVAGGGAILIIAIICVVILLRRNTNNNDDKKRNAKTTKTKNIKRDDTTGKTKLIVRFAQIQKRFFSKIYCSNDTARSTRVFKCS
jgi:hypothetical protein